MNKIKKLTAVLIALMLSFSAFACAPKGKDGQLGYVIDKSNMFGLCAVPNLGYSSSVDPGVSSELVCDLSQIMGVKSMRVWMHLNYVLEREKSSNTIKFKPKAVETFHAYIDSLKAAGVTNILVMSHFFLYPIEFLRPSNGGVVPEPDSDEYIIFMEMFQECFRMLSEEFPDVTYWEPHNEPNHPNGEIIVRQGFVTGNSTAQNAPYKFTDSETAMITADLCYYANLGIKASNPQNQLVLPGMVFQPNAATAVFWELLYEEIESGNLPTSFDEDGKRKIPADTNSDNYFNVVNWHPYANTDPSEEWLAANVAIYDVVIKHGDKGKKIFITEFGWHDDFSAERVEKIGEWYPKAYDMLIEALPYLETIFAFRMFNWISTGSNVKDMEKTFGIFTSPSEAGGVVPKPAALAMFKYFNGENADTSPLYKYEVKIAA